MKKRYVLLAVLCVSCFGVTSCGTKNDNAAATASPSNVSNNGTSTITRNDNDTNAYPNDTNRLNTNMADEYADYNNSATTGDIVYTANPDLTTRDNTTTRNYTTTRDNTTVTDNTGNQTTTNRGTNNTKVQATSTPNATKADR